MLRFLKNHYFIALVVLLAALIIAFSNILFMGRTLTTSATTVGTTRNGPYKYPAPNERLIPNTDRGASAWHFEPAMQLNSQAYKSGELPLWNPYNGAGQPLAGDMQSASFFPLSLPLIVNPSPIMWDLFLLFRLLIAGFLAFVFLRLINIGTKGSIAGALVFMLSGYLLFYVNMTHLNVEILIPLMLIAVELIFQKRNLFSASVVAISTALVLLGGMPESAFVNLGFASTYFLYRSFTEYRSNPKKNYTIKTGSYFSLGLLAGFLISGIGWIPFVQYSQLFWSNHNEATKGLISLPSPLFVQHLAPMFVGAKNVAYIGIIPLFLSIVVKKDHKFKWFFSIAAVIVGLKLFGVAINWLGYLPFLDRVFFFKYGQALFAISIAVLTAMAVDSGFKTKLWRPIVLSVIWVGALYYFLTNIEQLFSVKSLRLSYYAPVNTKWALVFLGLSLIIVLAPKMFKKLKTGHLAVAVIALIFIELWVHVPADRALRHDPYIAPPFVQHLQKQEGSFRTYGLHAVFWPNTNAPYGIEDIRSLNAIQPRNYMDYLSLFSDLKKKGHITGLEGANLESQFFDALNIKYVLALKPLENNLDFWFSKADKTKINDVTWFKPPFNAQIIFPKDVRFLNFSTKTSVNENVKIEAVTNKGSSILFEEPISIGEHNHQIDVSRLAGKTRDIKISSTALVNSFHFSNSADLSSKFKQVFKDEKVRTPVTIYENLDVMNRVVLYDKVRRAKGNQVNAIKSLDIRTEALVEKPLRLDSKKKLKYRARLTSYKPQEVKITVDSNKKALLVLADTYYPGWKAYVDGKEKEVIETNIMFRGVEVDEKSKEVVFAYDPFIYKASFGLSGFVLLAMFALGFVSYRRKY